MCLLWVVMLNWCLCVRQCQKKLLFFCSALCIYMCIFLAFTKVYPESSIHLSSSLFSDSSLFVTSDFSGLIPASQQSSHTSLYVFIFFLVSGGYKSCTWCTCVTMAPSASLVEMTNPVKYFYVLMRLLQDEIRQKSYWMTNEDAWYVMETLQKMSFY